MKSYVNIEFASAKIKAIDHFDDICKAVAYATAYVKRSSDIQLYMPILSKSNGMVWIPIECCDPIKNVGHHLRGVSYYLLHRTSFDYSKYLSGQRLLWYKNYASIPNYSTESNKPAYRVMTIEQIEKELGYRIKIVSG